MPQPVQVPLIVPTHNNLLPPGVPAANYRMDTIQNVKSWKARILLGNSAGENQDVGDWDDVGYVMVSVTGPVTFIPIANADEHQSGFELIHKFAGSWGIKTEDWVPISPNGIIGLYIYKTDLSTHVEASRRWLAAGGPSFVVKSVNAFRGEGWVTDAEDFVQEKGVVRLQSSGLLKPGNQILQALDRLIKILNNNRSPVDPNQYDEAIHKYLPGALNRLHDILAKYWHFSAPVLYSIQESAKNEPVLPPPWMQLFSQQKLSAERQEVLRHFCQECLKEHDIKALERLIVSHMGIKNALHMAVREELRGPSYKQDMRNMFGDLEAADRLLGMIDRSPYEPPVIRTAPGM